MPIKKIKVGIIGTGNIGTDLLIKIQRSDFLECSIFAGRNSGSEGMKKALSLGVKITDKSIKTIEENPLLCQIVFDATSAKAHRNNAPILKKLKKFCIDLTPAQIGKMCIPAINLNECMNSENVNMITCAGQATIPLISCIMKVHPETEYIEVVSSISSKSAGPGTRTNIDEFTQTTREAIIQFSGVKKAKAIIILNPAEPPVLMHNTIYAVMKNPDLIKLSQEFASMSEKIKKYVPGFKVTLGPVAEHNRITTMIEVVGLGDFLPRYSGNLDIITSAAINTAEEYAKRKILGLK